MKYIDEEDMQVVAKWYCPYKSCGKENEDDEGILGEQGEFNCSYCNRLVKIREPKYD